MARPDLAGIAEVTMQLLRRRRQRATMQAGSAAQCGAYTRAGRRCRLPAVPGSANCALHRGSQPILTRS
jgi:hypothetical protein